MFAVPRYIPVNHGSRADDVVAMDQVFKRLRLCMILMTFVLDGVKGI